MFTHVRTQALLVTIISDILRNLEQHVGMHVRLLGYKQMPIGRFCNLASQFATSHVLGSDANTSDCGCAACKLQDKILIFIEHALAPRRHGGATTGISFDNNNFEFRVA